MQQDLGKTDLVYDHWARHTLDFVAPHLERARDCIRIATGFFTVEGYDLIRRYLEGKRVYILVGYDETSRERLREKLIEDIMQHLRMWDSENRRVAVIDLVAKLQQGELHVIEQGSSEVLDARTRNKDHAKVFILDQDRVLVGSGNLTVNGMRQNAEGVTCVDIPERVAHWLGWFETYWNAPDTYDLTQALLEALLDWLKLHLPFDVYLKTVLALIPEDETAAPRDGYKMPAKYQQVVIERVLRQLKEWRGAMLVASTGLGKTVMATHTAYRLAQEGRIRNVVVFAPLQVHPDWDQALDSAGLSSKIITRNLLDTAIGRKGKATRQMEEVLARIDEQYLIIVDESQYFKNRLRALDGRVRYSFQRLAEVVRERGAYIVLLTATPLAKGVQDLNNQLYLLPHGAEPCYRATNGQIAIPGMVDDQIHPHSWKVPETEHFFDEFINLPVCTVISTSQVAKNFAIHTPEGDYVEFGAQRRWIPEIAVHRIKAPVPLENAMSFAIRKGYFKHHIRRFRIRGEWQHSETTIQKEAEVAWTSSPLALSEVIRKTLDGTYGARFVKSEDERARVLGPIQNQLKAMTCDQDAKFLGLCRILEQHQRQGQKVVIFTERHATAVYLGESLARVLPYLRIANAVQREGDDFTLRDFDTVFDLLLDFAPQANEDKIQLGRRSRPYDVFITTDAYGAGVNLQDAAVVISYDLAWTAETLIQRAGRILRLWHYPRRVSLYVFVGDFREDPEGMRQMVGINRRLERLTQRSRQAERFSELPVFPQDDVVEYASLGDLSSVTIADLGLADITEIEEFTGVSRFLHHITALNQNLEYANQIPDDISSAMTYPGKNPQFFLLLRDQHEYHWVLYDIQQQQMVAIQEDRLLDLIQCTANTPVAAVVPDIIEGYAQQCRQLWLAADESRTARQVERVCALYLVPEGAEGEFEPMLREQLRAAKVG